MKKASRFREAPFVERFNGSFFHEPCVVLCSALLVEDRQTIAARGEAGDVQVRDRVPFHHQVAHHVVHLHMHGLAGRGVDEELRAGGVGINREVLLGRNTRDALSDVHLHHVVLGLAEVV